MLIPGIKLGPQDWQTKLKQAHPQCVEIWYRADQSAPYQDMLQTLKQEGIPFGLHFWGITKTGHEANLAYPSEDLDDSIELVSQTISDAGNCGATYVNVHSGNTRLLHLNLDDWSMAPDPDSSEIPDAQAIEIRNKLLEQLGDTANNLGLKLQVELIPQAAHNHGDRSQPVSEYPASPKGLMELCRNGYIGFTNDFCHTFAYSPADFDSLTEEFSSYTNVIHANTLTPPYNGTDEHRGILPEDFSQEGIFPSRQKFIHLIKSLESKAKSDIWIIGEPQDNHVQNYIELKKILDEVE